MSDTQYELADSWVLNKVDQLRSLKEQIKMLEKARADIYNEILCHLKNGFAYVTKNGEVIAKKTAFERESIKLSDIKKNEPILYNKLLKDGYVTISECYRISI